MPDLLIFRPANPNDVDQIVEMIHELADYEKLTHELELTPEKLSHSLFVEKSAQVILACLNETIIGYAVLCKHFSTFKGESGIYLDDLYIKTSYRSKGYGKQLFQYVVNFVSDAGHPRLEWLCLDWNQNSIDFYLKHGAEQLKDYTMYRLEGEKLNQRKKK